MGRAREGQAESDVVFLPSSPLSPGAATEAIRTARWPPDRPPEPLGRAVTPFYPLGTWAQRKMLEPEA